MARLLRLHFASIGHAHARLSPLTLDFRQLSNEVEPGSGIDSILWLRNGGGKSSIINLFYSVLRPNKSEFLGSSAEGKARRLEDYVKPHDLAFVVSEWDIAPASGPDAYTRPPATIRLVGQVLAWRNQQRTELVRMFFSLRSIPGTLELEDLPILGLGEPCESLADFRQWLRDTTHLHPETEVVDTTNQRKWRDNLERLGIDTELFRYQLLMNRREGAADEVFRFGSAEDFINFFLELTLEREGAEQLAKNIEAQRDTLRRRPEYLLEQTFIAGVRATLVPLVDAVDHERDCDTKSDLALQRAAALIAGLEDRATQLERRQGEVAQALESAQTEHGIARNERDKRSRWIRGLERRALELDLRDAEQALEFADESKQQIDGQLRINTAARVLREVRVSEENVAHWKAELQRSERDLAPQRHGVESTGAILRAALAKALAMRRATKEAHERERATRLDEAKRARTELSQHDHELGRLQQEVASLDGQIKHYTRAREQLIKRAVLETHEAATGAAERWQSTCETLELRGIEIERARDEVATELRALNERVAQLETRKATCVTSLGELDRKLAQAYTQRDRLRTDPWIIEVEETDEPELDTIDLGRRLRQRAESERRQLLQSKVDGAEDRRAIAGIDADGLWPPKRDVQLVTEALQADGINAHSGLSYLENVAADARADYIRSAPATFSGVVIIGDDMNRVREQVSRLPRLHMPVQISRIIQLELDSAASDEERVVVEPDPATYDRRAATERKLELERGVDQRQRRELEHTEREREFNTVADELARYLGAFGQGALERFEQRAHATRTEIAQIEAELSAHTRERGQLARRDIDLKRERDEVTQAEREARDKLRAVENFIENHEAGVSAARDRREAAAREGDEHERQRELQRKRAESLTELADDLQVRALEAQTAGRELAREHAQVRYHDDSAPPSPLPDLEFVRARYDALCTSYETALGESVARSMLAESEKTLAKRTDRYTKVAEGLERAAIEDKLRTSEDLEREQERLELDLLTAVEQIGEAKNQGETVRRNLAETKKRREAADLPPNVEPTSGQEARALGRRYAAELEQHNEAMRRSQAAIEAHETNQRTLRDEHVESTNAAKNLRTMVETVGLEVPTVPAISPPLDATALRRVIDEHKQSFTTSRKQLSSARDTTRQLTGQLRKHTSSAAFAQLDRQYKDRLAASDEELRETANTLRDELEARFTVLAHQLEQYDRDRKLLVQHLQRLTDDAERVLKRAQRASTLPDELEGWGGRSYMRLRYTLPETDIEREARLGPLVDQILEAGALPSGLELVRRAVHELARPAGFDVKILKPDTVLRPEPIPIAAMASFSRGQQLTAAILLYCTLVQLRAQNRGHGQGRKDAGVLLLDNPLGTCSTVALVKLQRRIAGQMNVQLIYTTGIEDREAISVMPNTIRLRNTHRDTRTGDNHITEDSIHGLIEQARVVDTGDRS